MHTYAHAKHSAPRESCRSKSGGAWHVFLTSDWQYLISCCLRFPVKLLWQRIEAEIGFFTAGLHSQELIYDTYREILFLQNKGSLQQYTDQLERRQFKDTRKKRCARCCWQTCMLTEILRSCAHRGGRVNPLALYIFCNPSTSMYMKQSACCFFGDICPQRPTHLRPEYWLQTFIHI